MKRPECREAARVAALFLVALDRAELDPRLPRGLGGGEAGVDQISRACVEMLPQLVPHVALEPRPSGQRIKHVPEPAQHVRLLRAGA